MAKKSAKTKRPAKKSTTSKKSFSAWRRTHKLLFAALLVFGLFAAWQAKRQYDISQERQDFKQAEQVVSGLVGQIQAELGQTKVEEYRQCSYGTVKFEKKNLGCSFRYSFSYQLDSLEDSQAYINKAVQYINESENLEKTFGNQPLIIQPFAGEAGNIKSESTALGFKSEKFQSIDCSVNFTHFIDLRQQEKIEKLKLSFNCHSKDNVKTNYYPLIN